MGGIATQVTTHGGVNQAGVWGPDSDQLAYLSVVGAGGCEIRTARVSRPEETRIRLVSQKACFPESFDGEHIIIWKQGDDLLFTPWAISVKTGEEVQLGTPHENANVRNLLVELNERGKQLFRALYPSGRHVYADGDQKADIYRVPVEGLLRTGFAPAE
jgi:hypothetical protein